MSMPRFSLPVMDTLNTAWNKVSGAKASFWACLGLIFLIQAGTQIAQFILLAIPFVGIIIGIPFAIAASILLMLLGYGIFYLALRRSKDEAFSYKDMFYTLDWQLALNLLGLTILQVLIVLGMEALIFASSLLFMFGILAAILGGIFIFIGICAAITIMIRLSVSFFFMIDERTTPVDAMKKSWYATEGNFWPMLGVFFMLWIVLIISAIPLGIGLIWTIPLAWITIATAYLRLRHQR